MNRIEKCFEQLKKENKKALITFITSGDPDIETTEKAALEMFDKGADIIELGVPFSDPVAEGVTIQKASLRALQGGVNLDKIFGCVKNIRKSCDKPILLMMYLNTIFVYGADKFFKACSDSGIDGVIVPDMPYEERGEIADFADKYGVINVNLVAPTSHDRIKEIAANSKGFLYCVSSTGVTGVRSSFSTDLDEFFGAVKKYAACPCTVGFGISGPEQAKKMSEYCDGVIVGSAIVRLFEEAGKEAVTEAGEFVRSLKETIC